jgi:hypothetical protein
LQQLFLKAIESAMKTGIWNVAAEAVGIVLLCVCQEAAARPLFTLSTDTTAITEPVRDDGSVDYVAAINKRFSQGVTPQNNGFVLWLRLMGRRSTPDEWRKRSLDMCGGQALPPGEQGWTGYSGNSTISQGPMRLWKAQEEPALAAFLKDREKLLDIATQAAAKPKWWAPAVSGDGMMAMVLLPELNQMRDVSRTFCERALLRAQQGDFDGFLADVMTVKRLARQESGWFIINRVVTENIDLLADQAIGAAAGTGQFSGAQCAKLAKALDALSPLPPMWEVMDLGTRWSTLDRLESLATGRLQRLASGDNPANAFLKQFKSLDWDSVNWDVLLRRANGLIDEMVEIMKVPSVSEGQIARQIFDWKLEKLTSDPSLKESLARQAGETSEAYTERVAGVILIANLPIVWRSEDFYRAAVMQENMTRAVVAAGQFRADKGKWPERLEDLVPGYLPEAPKDVFSLNGTDLVGYQATAAGILLHATVPNRKDNYGNPYEIEVGVAQNAPTDGM